MSPETLKVVRLQVREGTTAKTLWVLAAVAMASWLSSASLLPCHVVLGAQLVEWPKHGLPKFFYARILFPKNIGIPRWLNLDGLPDLAKYCAGTSSPCGHEAVFELVHQPRLPISPGSFSLGSRAYETGLSQSIRRF